MKENPMAEELQLSLLGDVVVRRNGVPVTDVGSSKALALLCFLALTGRPHLRSTLAGLLWGDRSETRARSNLSKALTHLRRVVGPFLSITRQAVAFNRERSYWLDVERFEALAGRATLEAMSASAAPLQADIERLEQAVELYRGDLLEGFYVRQAPAFEDWVLAQRARLRELALQALHRLLVHHVRRGAAGLAAGIEVATRLLALEPWREDAHRQLMTLLAQSGQRGAALAQYKTCRQVLAKELGVEPGVETTALYEQIRDGEVASQRQKETILQAPAIVTQPPAVLDSTLAALGGERRPVTVLQAKVGEAAALLDEIGHERWTATLNDVLQIASSTIERYGGEVHERHGDGLIALFGVPSAHEDDAERAILAALAMQDQIG
jgi:DNA-binding SARP family transcriptional activator